MIIKKVLLAGILLCINTASVIAIGSADSTHASMVKNGLKVSADKHYLVDAITAKPVFILATTAWNINSLTYAEIDTLLQATASHGFNSIMFALDFYPQADEPNVYGQKAYIGDEKTDLNPAYFKYC